jgi:uncharacterized protein involved in tolerance to divalent cations
MAYRPTVLDDAGEVKAELIDGTLLYPWENLVFREDEWGVVVRSNEYKASIVGQRVGIKKAYGTHTCTSEDIEHSNMAPFGEFCWVDEEAIQYKAKCAYCGAGVPEGVVALVRLMNMDG